jgi:hypothetical protein
MRLESMTPASAGAASGRGVRAILTLMLAASLALVLAIPADAATTASTTVKTGTWVGQVERNGDHFEYGGRACPIEEPVCIDIFVRYPIVPLTPQAARALPQVAGGTAKLLGSLVTTDGSSKLLVRHVSKA